VDIYDLLPASFKSELGSVIRWVPWLSPRGLGLGVPEGPEVNGEILPHKWTAKMFHVKHFRPLFVFDSNG
jgi:hypothetical protein